MNDTLLAEGLAAIARGWAVTPLAGKRPLLDAWTTQPTPTAEQVREWVAAGYNLGLRTGSASGGLLVLDVDTHGDHDGPQALADIEAQHEPLPATTVAITGGGGYHVYLRLPPSMVVGNHRLCAGVDVRCECGQVVYPGSIHPDSGQPYTWHTGPQHIAKAPEWLVQRLLTPPPPVMPPRPSFAATMDAERPGDDYNRRGDIGELLRARNWTCVGEKGVNQLWRRPGKDRGEHSATFDGRVFYVWSTNAPPFDAPQGYSPFAVYAILEHGGDFDAATRALSDLGYGRRDEPPSERDYGVDLSDLLSNMLGPEPVDHDPDPEDPGRLPANLYAVPGLVTEYCQWVLSTAPYPCPEATLCGALALMSWLTARKLRAPSGLRTNLYAICLAESGTGKNRPREANAAILGGVDALRELVEQFSSGESIEDALLLDPAVLWQCDEFDQLLGCISRDTGPEGGRWGGISAALRTIYSASGGPYACRRRAAVKGQRQHAASVYQPHLTMFATATPQAFFDALSVAQTIDGLLSRCILLDVPTGLPRAGQTIEADISDVPPGIMARVSGWRAWTPGGNLASENPVPAIVYPTDEAATILSEYQAECDDKANTVRGETAAAARAIWARAWAVAWKLAMIHAASRAVPPDTFPAIDTAAAQWATSLSDYLAERLLYHLHRYSADGPFARACKQLLRFLEDNGGQAPMSVVRRHLAGLGKRLRDETISSLVEQERVEHCQIKAKRKTVAGLRRL